MEHVSISKYHGVGNRSEEVGGEMVIGISGRRRTVGGLCFPEMSSTEAEDS